jgi:hypothetical protein
LSGDDAGGGRRPGQGTDERHALWHAERPASVLNGDEQQRGHDREGQVTGDVVWEVRERRVQQGIGGRVHEGRRLEAPLHLVGHDGRELRQIGTTDQGTG